MANCAWIYQPHYKSNCARVAVDMQQADVNYIIITCSPSCNGVWKYQNRRDYELWLNNKKVCYCVPMDELEFVMPLENLDDKRKVEVKKDQAKWFKNEVKNRNYEYKNKPEWML